MLGPLVSGGWDIVMLLHAWTTWEGWQQQNWYGKMLLHAGRDDNNDNNDRVMLACWEGLGGMAATKLG
jgi:hypothetical protein